MADMETMPVRRSVAIGLVSSNVSTRLSAAGAFSVSLFSSCFIRVVRRASHCAAGMRGLAPPPAG